MRFFVAVLILAVSVSQPARSQAESAEALFAKAFLTIQKLEATKLSDKDALEQVTIAKLAIDQLQRQHAGHPLTTALFGPGVETFGGMRFQVGNVIKKLARLDRAVKISDCSASPSYECATNLAIILSSFATRTEDWSTLCEAAAENGNLKKAQNYERELGSSNTKSCVTSIVGRLLQEKRLDAAAAKLYSASPTLVEDEILELTAQSLLVADKTTRAVSLLNRYSGRKINKEIRMNLAAHLWQTGDTEDAIKFLSNKKNTEDHAIAMLDLAKHFVDDGDASAAMRILHDFRVALIQSSNSTGDKGAVVSAFLSMARFSAANDMKGAAIADFSTALQLQSLFGDFEMHHEHLVNAAITSLEVRGEAGSSRAEILLLKVPEADVYEKMAEYKKKRLHGALGLLAQTYRRLGLRSVGIDALSQVYARLGLEAEIQCPLVALSVTREVLDGSTSANHSEKVEQPNTLCGPEVFSSYIVTGQTDRAIQLLPQLGAQLAQTYNDSREMLPSNAEFPYMDFAEAVVVGETTLDLLEQIRRDALKAEKPEVSTLIVDKIAASLAEVPRPERARLAINLSKHYHALGKMDQAKVLVDQAVEMVVASPNLQDAKNLVATLTIEGRDTDAVSNAFAFEQQGWSAVLLASYAAAKARLDHAKTTSDNG